MAGGEMDLPPLSVREEQPSDGWEVRELLIEAFGGNEEAVLVERLRDAGDVEFATVAVEAGRIVGYVCVSPVSVLPASADDPLPSKVLSLAPMAVLPERQRRGVGSRLVENAIRRAKLADASALVVLGHPEFYARFGFRSEAAQQLANPFGGGDAWMALELQPGGVADVEGTVRYPPAFDALLQSD